MNIAARIREAAEANGISLAEVARRSSMYPQDLNRILHLKVSRSGKLPKLAAALGVDVAWLTTGSEQCAPSWFCSKRESSVVVAIGGSPFAFRSRIARAIYVSGKSQSTVAQSVGIRRQYLNKIMSGNRSGDRWIAAIARELDVSVCWLQTGFVGECPAWAVHDELAARMAMLSGELANRVRLLEPGQFRFPADGSEMVSRLHYADLLLALHPQLILDDRQDSDAP